MKILLTTGLLLLSAGVLLARPADRGRGHGPRDGCTGACAVQAAATVPLTLSPAAQGALRLQIDEERMAGKLYQTFGEKQDAKPFKNIPHAETRHRQMLENLATRAGLAPAGKTTAGRFETAAIQGRYDTLLARGQTSLLEALKVGALVEEQDIADLRLLAAATDNPELKSVVMALEQGSRNHLNAFVRNLWSRGVDYAAQILTPAELKEITSTGMGRPGRRRANRVG